MENYQFFFNDNWQRYDNVKSFYNDMSKRFSPGGHHDSLYMKYKLHYDNNCHPFAKGLDNDLIINMNHALLVMVRENYKNTIPEAFLNVIIFEALKFVAPFLLDGAELDLKADGAEEVLETLLEAPWVFKDKVAAKKVEWLACPIGGADALFGAAEEEGRQGRP